MNKNASEAENSNIWKAIRDHNRQNRANFHTPAHKGSAECLAPLAGVLGLDLTELPDTGSLFDGEGATAQAEVFAADVFKTAATFMSAGGCTLCVQAMLRLAAPRGGKVICGRVIHRSAVNAMALLGIDPVWVEPDRSAGLCFAGRITGEAVGAALEKNPDAKAVYITTPDYFGVLSDINAISLRAREYAVPVIADNAHGAHLPFIDASFGPLARGAAMSADSAHKTLPVLTGGAWLNIASADFAAGARDALSLFGSTSPSYPILLSLDLCARWLADGGPAALRALAAEIAQLKAFAESLGFQLPAGECDPLRIAFQPGRFGLNGREAAELLRQNGVEPEYAGPAGVALIPSPFNTPADYETLRGALEAISRRPSVKSLPRFYHTGLPETAMSPREALLCDKETVAVENAVGRVAAQTVCPCPPAIPAVVPGEAIGPQALRVFEDYGIRNIAVVKSGFSHYNNKGTKEGGDRNETDHSDCQQR